MEILDINDTMLDNDRLRLKVYFASCPMIGRSFISMIPCRLGIISFRMTTRAGRQSGGMRRGVLTETISGTEC